MAGVLGSQPEGTQGAGAWTGGGTAPACGSPHVLQGPVTTAGAPAADTSASLALPCVRSSLRSAPSPRPPQVSVPGSGPFLGPGAAGVLLAPACALRTGLGSELGGFLQGVSVRGQGPEAGPWAPP